MKQLDILAKHRDQLLLAEAAGWLHDYRKCSDERLQGSGLNRHELKCKFDCIDSTGLSILGFSENLFNLLKWDDERTRNSFNTLGHYLIRCHRTAHFDKQEPIGQSQRFPDVRLSSPFGYESIPLSGLTHQLWRLPWSDICHHFSTNRDAIVNAIRSLFSRTIADLRHPINEVDLWSWGMMVGALYKAALAGALLTGQTPNPSDLRWRLLSVRVAGLDYLLSVTRIPDLLARHALLTDALDRVRVLLEVIYPLGTEVYRDENGSIFVVPDVPDLLDRIDRQGEKLYALIQREFAQGTIQAQTMLQIGGELTPQIDLEERPWWGQDPNWPRSFNDELPKISGFLNQDVSLPANPGIVSQYWLQQAAADICTVCGLRPQGPGHKASERRVCDICEERRSDRSRLWATTQQDQTIWIDEVADTNGRIALITGHFDLTHWLDGTLVQSLLLIAPHDPDNLKPQPVTPKTPSFSRLKRMWETTRTFWQEVQETIIQQLSDDRRRIKIYLDRLPNLAPYHVYDLVIGPTDLSVVWVPPQGAEAGYLLSADNFGIIARQLGAKSEEYQHPATAAIFVEEYLQQHISQPVLRNPDILLPQPRVNLLAGCNIQRIVYQEHHYATLIPILLEPRSFMIIVPADQALRIVQLIKDKYTREMAKVRDRLPIHLSCVYAHRRIPLRALLDAGRAMLARRVFAQQWLVSDCITDGKTIQLIIHRQNHQLSWCIPRYMANGTTEDRWYPYVFLATNGDDQQADANHRRACKVKRPVSSAQTVDEWIVHMADIRPGETIFIWPSTFDFTFLDASARRFELHYDEQGRRSRTRPWYLEDVDRLERLWEWLRQLTPTQRYQIVRAIEETRELWYGPDTANASPADPVFRRFVADTLAGAEWQWAAIPAEWQIRLIEAGARGELADVVELHMEILKENL